MDTHTTKEHIKREIDDVSEKIDSLNKASHEKYASEQQSLAHKRDSLKTMWEHAKEESGEAWEGIKDGIRHSVDELKSSYHDLKMKM